MLKKLKSFFSKTRGTELVEKIFGTVISVALMAIAITYVTSTVYDKTGDISVENSPYSYCKETVNGKSDLYVIVETNADPNSENANDETYYTISYRDYNNRSWTKPNIIKTKKDATGHHLVSFDGKSATEIQNETGINEKILADIYLELIKNAIRRYGSDGGCS